MLIWLGLRAGLALAGIGAMVWFSGAPAVGVPLIAVGALMYFAARADEKRNA